jgi:hypothetical protein
MAMCQQEITDHAAWRMQKRSISPEGIELLLDHGVRRHCGRGCESYAFDRRSWKKALERLGSQRIVEMEKFKNAYVVISSEGSLVTAAWRR